jgi:hypothetical protein
VFKLLASDKVPFVPLGFDSSRPLEGIGFGLECLDEFGFTCAGDTSLPLAAAVANRCHFLASLGQDLDKMAKTTSKTRQQSLKEQAKKTAQ